MILSYLSHGMRVLSIGRKKWSPGIPEESLFLYAFFKNGLCWRSVRIDTKVWRQPLRCLIKRQAKKICVKVDHIPHMHSKQSSDNGRLQGTGRDAGRCVMGRSPCHSGWPPRRTTLLPSGSWHHIWWIRIHSMNALWIARCSSPLLQTILWFSLCLPATRIT